MVNKLLYSYSRMMNIPWKITPMYQCQADPKKMRKSFQALSEDGKRKRLKNVPYLNTDELVYLFLNKISML
jgi:hypothetical protein